MVAPRSATGIPRSRSIPANRSAPSMAAVCTASKPASSNTSSDACAHSTWCGTGKPVASRRASGCSAGTSAFSDHSMA